MVSSVLGLGTTFQRVPFQCMIRVRYGPQLSPMQPGVAYAVPTAQILCAQEAVTPNSAALPARLGLATSRQCRPFQNAVSVLELPSGMLVVPTAHALFAAITVTPLSQLALTPPGLGLAHLLHLVPFQCATSIFEPAEPTAQALVADRAATAVNWPPPGSDGKRCTVQCRPFQCSISG